MMSRQLCETVIVGGGLSGAHTAYRLSQQGKDSVVLESRPEAGGRLLSQDGLDLGGTWLWDSHTRIRALLKELALETFSQAEQGLALHEQGSRIQPFHAASGARAHRIVGGASRLVETLQERANAARFHGSTAVEGIDRDGDMLTVRARRQGISNAPILEFNARHVVLALPHRLIANIQFGPPLPRELLNALRTTPTWMAGHAKFVARYATPFWRRAGLSGQAFSRVGPLWEIHDASPKDTSCGALMAFLDGGADATRMTKLAIAQLVRLFGDDAGTPLATYKKDWRSDAWTATQADHEPCTVHPAYGLPAGAAQLLGGRLLLSGTESARAYGGYMEGAIEASENVLQTLFAP